MTVALMYGRLRAAVKTLLTKIEWEGDDRNFECPSCRASKVSGHEAGCELKELLDLVQTPVEDTLPIR